MIPIIKNTKLVIKGQRILSLRQSFSAVSNNEFSMIEGAVLLGFNLAIPSGLVNTFHALV